MSGHVDGVGEVISREENARAIEFRIRAPKELAKYKKSADSPVAKFLSDNHRPLAIALLTILVGAYLLAAHRAPMAAAANRTAAPRFP